MDFRILGPLEVIGADGALPLRGAKRRGLVALLAVRAGEWQPLDRIVHELWGEEATTGAARTVQTYVSQLRAVLDGAAITAREGGYRLEAPPEAVDAWRFEQQVAEASGLDDPKARADLLTDALGTWRGRPLDEFDDDWAQGERGRLELLHLQARELHIEARLALGAARDVVPELERLVDDNPLDERFWAQLLLAYYRCGRQADALRAFQRARTALAAELGIEPGPELVRLEQRILDQDDSLRLDEGPRAGGGPTLPSGTVTFLFTDIADSTRLWEVRPHEMATTLASHDAALDEVVEGHGGRIVKSTGDGLLAVFADAERAVEAAAEGQRRIAAATWPVTLRVRMGLHTGSATPEAGDYHAPAVNRASRVAGIAHAEQVLLSEATAGLLDDVGLRDLGEHRLRGLAPMRLFQLLGDGLRVDFPPTSASATIGLPSPETSFVGRDEQLERLPKVLADHRLVTLTGAGGCGKTRLAVEAAHRAANDFRDGVRFVDLAAATEDDAVDTAVVDALGLAAAFDADQRQRIVAYLAERQVLVVLDNCEHLLDGCADLAAAVLAAPGPGRLLATSREPLGLVDELVLTLPSLETASEAVRLFVDRARAVRSDLELGPGASEVLEQICRRLDGIPLAIELAAAHTSVLSPDQILERLDARFLVLTGGQRRIQRQQTLAATLDWSWDLLGDDDRQALARLAAFPANFTLDAAEAVVDRPDTFERIRSLTAKSLVAVHPGPQYRLLETVRLYAEAKLVDTDDAVPVRTRQRDWVLAWLDAMPWEERWFGDEDLLEEGMPNVRAAVEWSLAAGDREAAATIVGGLDWSRRESSMEAVRWTTRLLDERGLPGDLEAVLHFVLWWAGPVGTQWPTLRHSERVVELTSGRGGPLEPLGHLAIARDHIIPATTEGDEELMRFAEEQAAQAVALSTGGHLAIELYSRMWFGMTLASFLKPERAMEEFAAGLELPRTPPYTGLHDSLQAYLAIACLVVGEDERAAGLARAACSPEAIGRYWQHARADCLVALAATGDFASADQALKDYREVCGTIDWVYAAETVVVLAGVLAAMREDWPTAARLLAAGAAGVRRTPADFLLYMHHRDRTRTALGPERSRALRAEGRAMSIDQAMALAFPDDA